MNPETTMLLPVPMVKEETVKEDGRFLIYYSFPDAHTEKTNTKTTDTEDADV